MLDRWRFGVPLRFQWLFHGKRQQNTLDEELQFHVDQLIDQFLEQGLAPQEAKFAALRQMDGLLRHSEECREVHRFPFVDRVIQDGRYALRMMRKAPGLTIVALLTLGVGIGANTTIFSVLKGVLVSPLPDADRIVWLFEQNPRGEQSAISTLNYLDWQKDSSAFEKIAAWGFGSVTLGEGTAPTPLRTVFASPQYFEIFAAKPVIGRVFAPDEGQPGRNRVAILSAELWASAFGGDPAVVGRTVRLQGEPYTVIGVMPREASAIDWSWTELWLPLTFEPSSMTRNYRWFNAYGKINRAVTIDQARADLARISASLEREYPESNKGWSVGLQPYVDVLAGRGLKRSVYVLFAAVAAVLLMGCVNLANILISRGLSRQREVAIRAALGGGRARLIQQFLTESLLLTAGGAVLGLLIGYAGIHGLKAALPSYSSPNAGVPPAAVVTLDGGVLIFTLVASVVSLVAFGLLPALMASRPDLSTAVKEGEGHRAGTGKSQVRLRGVLITVEVALAFMLLTSSGLLIRSLLKLQHIDLGFDPTNVLTATIPLATQQTQGDPDRRTAYLIQLVDTVQAVPGVGETAIASVLPLRGWGSELPFHVGNDPPGDPAGRPLGFFKSVTPSYFTTLRIPLRRGRLLDDRDVEGSPRTAVINETMARRYFRDEDPIGRQVLMPEILQTGRSRLGADVSREVVGIVADEKVTALRDARESPGVYVSIRQSSTRRPTLVVRGAVDVRPLERAIRTAIATTNKDQPLADVSTLSDVVSQSIAADRQRSVLLAAFACVAMLLAALGIYGVMSYAVTQRTPEFRLRLALGASPRHAVGLILRQGMAMTGLGLLLGGIGAIAVNRMMASLLFGVIASDGLTIAVTVLTLSAVSMIACCLPASRIARCDLTGVFHQA